MIKVNDFVMTIESNRRWFGYVEKFVEPNNKGILVRWAPTFTSWHDHDELTVVDFPVPSQALQSKAIET